MKHLFRMLLIVFLLVACTGGEQRHAVTPEQRAAIDSMVGTCSDAYQMMQLQKKFEKEGNGLGLVVVYRELSKHYRNQSNFDRSIDIQNQGLKLATEIADTIEMVRALNNIATSYRRLGLLDLATEKHYQALEYCMRAKDDHSYEAQKNRVISLNGLGNVYLTLGDKHQADSVLREALKGEQQLNSPLGQAINYANLGSILEDWGQIDSAWVYYRKSMELNKQARSDLGISLCHNHFGRLYEKQKRYDKAIEEYTTAYNLMQQSRDEWHALESGIALARIYWKTGQTREAFSYLDNARNIAKRIKSIEHLADIHQLYYSFYRSQGNIEQALDNFIRASEYDDSVLNLKKVNDIQNMRLNLEQKRKQEEVDNARNMAENEKRTKNAALLVLLLLLILLTATVLSFSYALRLRKRHVAAIRQGQTAREHFFTNITHEFRTPLTVILGEGRELENMRTPDAQQVHTAANMIVRQGNSLLNLINQLLDISKVKSAIGEPDWRTGNIVAFISMTIESFQDYARQQQLELSFTPQEKDVQMDFVPDYMRKMMRNLISNAIKFTPKYGSISIAARRQGSKLMLTVADTGQGIDSQHLSHIFEAFYQGDSDNQSVGSGIGLSLVKQIVEAMNGTIGVESQPGKGTTFTMLLPLKHGIKTWTPLEEQPQPENLALAEEMPPLEDQITEDTISTRILIVEDNHDVAYYIGQQLRRKYNIAYATDGNQGISRAEEIVPDLIITDLMMPGIDGYELCRRVRLSPVLNHIPVIMITAKSTEEDRVRGLKAGADAYLYKPFNSDVLNVRVEMLLQQRRMLRNKFAHALIEGKESEVQLTAPERDFMQQVVDVIYKQMNQGTIDIGSVASGLCLSPSQFRRKLYALTGETPLNYILYVRMSYAKRLLDSRADLSIGDVALKCAFEDSSHFTRAFRQAFDMTPTQYRRKKS